MLAFALGVVAGLVLLVKAGDAFVGGAASLATVLRVAPVVVGAVVIGFGTSVPEMMVSALAAASGDRDLGVGNVVGSNLANLSLVLGTGALLTVMQIDTRVLRREAPVATASCALFAVLVWDGLSRREGLALVAALAGFLVWVLRDAGRAVEPELTAEVREFVDDFEEDLAATLDELIDGEPGSEQAPGEDTPPPSVAWLVAVTVVGLVGTLGGARLLVWGAVGIAEEAGLPQGFVGLTLVAVGTSLPELVTSVIAARRQEEELLVGNLLGSNVFNSLAVGGVMGIVGPGSLTDPTVAHRGIMTMMVVVSVAAVFMATGRRVGRIEAGVLLGGYALTLPLLAL